MPGMNRNSRSIRLIETYLADLESNASATAADALLALDEIRRLKRKWNEQVTAGSPRRIESDFKTMKGWLRQWLLAARRINERDGGNDDTTLRAAMAEIEADLKRA
jgi:hypothetical protein